MSVNSKSLSFKRLSFRGRKWPKMKDKDVSHEGAFFLDCN